MEVYLRCGDTFWTLFRGARPMPRRIRSVDLETRSARLRLQGKKKPYAVQVGPGIHLLYRRNKKVGAWVVKAALGNGRYWTDAFAHADDIEAAHGDAVLD